MPSSDDKSVFSLYELRNEFLEKSFRFIVVGIGMAIIGFTVASFIPKTYMSNATIFPSKTSAASSMNFANALSDSFQSILNSSSTINSGTKSLMAILNSRTIAETVIKSNDLMPIIFKKKWDAKTGNWRNDIPDDRKPKMQDAVMALKGKFIKITLDKKLDIINITSIFEDPQLAATVVNSYVKELRNVIDANSFSYAKDNRVYIGERLLNSKIELLEKEKYISTFFQQYTPRDQSRLTVNVDELLRTSGVPPESPEFKKYMESKFSITLPYKAYYEFLLSQKTLLNLVVSNLTTQYELAKIEEDKQKPSFQLIDAGVPADRKYAPKRLIYALLFASIGCTFYAVIIFRNFLNRY